MFETYYTNAKTILFTLPFNVSDVRWAEARDNIAGRVKKMINVL